MSGFLPQLQFRFGPLLLITATLASFFIGRDADEPSTAVAGVEDISALREESSALRLSLGRHEFDPPAEQSR